MVGMETVRGAWEHVERLPRRIDVPSQVVHGVISGVAGAFVVAVFFLVLDASQGRPLWTPHALGSALFLGEAPADGIRALLVLGYTITHGAAFVALGLLAATVLPALPGRRFFLGFVGLLVLMQVVFTLFSEIFAASPGADLRLAWVSFANLLAAAAMAGYLATVERSRPADPPEGRPS
jgi:hypothetical protein